MSHKDNQDLRNTGDGGWFYAENELFSVFSSLIGPDGVVVYMAMCRLIPLAAVDADLPVTARSVEEASCVKRTMANIKMGEIVALGMVDETPNRSRNRPSTYKLVSLRKLAQSGMAELRRRIDVHRADTDAKKAGKSRAKDGGTEGPQGLSGSGLPVQGEQSGLRLVPVAPAGSGESGVRDTDTEQQAGQEASGLASVSAKEGSVSARKGPVSATEGSVSAQRGHPLREEEFEEEENSPIAPKGALVEDGPELSFADCRFGDAKFEVNARDAAAWVMQQSGITTGVSSTRRLQVEIAESLKLRAKNTRLELAELARTAVKNWAVYRVDVEFAVNVQKAFSSGVIWTPDRWRLRRKTAAPAAAVGMRQAEPDTWEELRERSAAFFEANAAAIEKLAIAPQVVRRLRELGKRFATAPTHEGVYDDVEAEIEILEGQVFEALAGLETEAQMDRYRADVAAMVKPHQGRMNQKQISEACNSKLQIMLLKTAGVPRLSLFYLPKSAS